MPWYQLSWKVKDIINKKNTRCNQRRCNVQLLSFLFLNIFCFFSRAALNLSTRLPQPITQHQLIHVANNIRFGSFQWSLWDGLKHAPRNYYYEVRGASSMNEYDIHGTLRVWMNMTLTWYQSVRLLPGHIRPRAPSSES